MNEVSHGASSPLAMRMSHSSSLSIDLHVLLTLVQYMLVYRHMSQMHQRIRVGSRLPQNSVAFDMVAERRTEISRLETFESLRKSAAAAAAPAAEEL